MLVIAAFGLGGSVGSFLVTGAIFIALVSVSLGFTVLGVTRPILWLSAVCALYMFSGLLIVITHWGDNIALDQLLRYLTFCGLVFLWSRFAYTAPQLLLNAAVIGGIVCAFCVGGWAIYETIYHPLLRAEGMAGNALPFATVAGCGYFLSLIGIIVLKRKTSKIIAIAGLFLAMYAIFASQSRTMFPILLLAPIVAFILFPESRKLLTARTIFVLLIISGLVLFLNQDIMTVRFLTAVNYLSQHGFTPAKDDSLGIRFALWTCGSQAWAQNFWFGFGPENMRQYIETCTLELIAKPYTFTHFHNFVLTSLLNGGVVELLATTLILITPSALVLKYRDKTSFVSTAGAAIVLLTAGILLLQGIANLMFGHDIHDFLFIFLTALGLAIAMPRKQAYSLE